MSTGIGDEGGFAPDLEHNRAALDLIVEAIGKAGFTPGQDVALAIDAAASEFYADGAYNFEGKPQTSAQMTDIYVGWLGVYPISSIEGPLAEEDWPGWQQLTASVGDRVQVVVDDLFVTNRGRIHRDIADHSANSLHMDEAEVVLQVETRGPDHCEEVTRDPAESLGQCVFAVGPPNQYPDLYVDGLAQNYWVDMRSLPLPGHRSTHHLSIREPS